MFAFVSAIDQNVLHYLNGVWYHPSLDVFFRFVSNFKKQLPFLAVAAVALFIFGGNRWRYAFLLVGLAIGTADMVSTGVKEIAKRPRPQRIEIRQPEHYEYHGMSKSMPSNHATNTMAGALIVAWHLRKRRWAAGLCLVAPLLVGYSRIYLGVHYPSDVLAGYAVGLFTATTVLLLHTYIPVVNFEAGRECRFSFKGLTCVLIFAGLAWIFRLSCG